MQDFKHFQTKYFVHLELDLIINLYCAMCMYNITHTHHSTIVQKNYLEPQQTKSSLTYPIIGLTEVPG